jgi:DNA-directed RNA polymerase I, II, and III subunit RPABC1
VALFDGDGLVGVDTVRKVISECESRGFSHFVVVCASGLTFPAKRHADERTRDGIEIEYFTKVQLAIPVTHHALVPRHVSLTESEKQEFLQGLGEGATCECLAKLSPDDPVARYLNLTTGTVVRIERLLGELEPETTYRVVGK